MHIQGRREQILKYKLERLEEQRNLYWKQRAHAHWLDNGDRNIKFFHQLASKRKRRSRICKLVMEDGSVVEQEGEKQIIITNYYKSLFHANEGGALMNYCNMCSPK